MGVAESATGSGATGLYAIAAIVAAGVRGHHPPLGRSTYHAVTRGEDDR